jgi:large subunit ribosomal protein L25
MLPGDEARPSFVKHVQHHPIADNILHVDFLQISLKEKVRIDVPVHITGLAPAVDRYGGILTLGLDHITVEALPTDVPSAVEADVSSLEEVDSAFHVGDLQIPEGVTLLTDPEQVVAKVSPPAVVQVDVVEAVEGEEPGVVAAGAAGEEAVSAEESAE